MAMTPAEKMRAMRERKRQAGLVEVRFNVPADLAPDIRKYIERKLKQQQ